MTQVSSGIRSILAIPIIYDIFQNMMGARRIRREFVDEFVRPAKGARLLDIGCGTARLLDYLPPDIVYVGYDPSFDYIASARRNFGGRGEFIHGIYDEIAASNQQPFDLAVAHGVLHHLDDEQVTDLCELVRGSLKPQGRFVTLDTAFCRGRSPLARFLAARDRGLTVRLGEEYSALVAPYFTKVKSKLKCRLWYTHWIMECAK
jgi:SAM-dependent methyltransferase